MADYITVLSGEHRFRIRNPEEFEKRCREILRKLGDYDVEVDGDSASISGTGINFSLAELEEIRGPFGLRVERDRYWKPIPVSKILSGEAV